MNKKGIFFAIDAAIALTFLTVGVVFLFLTFTGQPVQQQAALYSSDVMSFFRDTRVSELNDLLAQQMACINQQDPCTPDITRPDQTLLSALAKLVADNKRDRARDLAMHLGNGLVQRQFGWNMSIMMDGEDVLLAENGGVAATQQVIVSHALVYYIKDDHSLGGPYVAQISVWQ